MVCGFIIILPIYPSTLIVTVINRNEIQRKEAKTLLFQYICGAFQFCSIFQRFCLKDLYSTLFSDSSHWQLLHGQIQMQQWWRQGDDVNLKLLQLCIKYNLIEGCSHLNISITCYSYYLTLKDETHFNWSVSLIFTVVCQSFLLFAFHSWPVHWPLQFPSTLPTHIHGMELH